MIAFACSHCAKSVQADDALAGKAVDCPHCGQSAAVPTATANQAAPPPPPRPADDATKATGAASGPALAPALSETRIYASGGDSGTYSFHPPSGEIPVEAGILAPPQQPDEIGRLGPYRVQKILGAGGMGIVFQGHDPILKRIVAIKAMLPSVAARPGNRERFLREAQSAAAIDSDHIVPIYNVGEERGIPYLVMRLLQGETLEARLGRERALPIAWVLRIGREIAEGLAAAHERSLIHRDVKPANVWLEAPRGRVKLLDFGLARPAADDSGITQTGVILGTPAYMSPEQARGRNIDPRSDLFSLGCVLYEICTGVLPFQGKDTLSRLLALSVDEPRPLRDLNVEAPAALADLVAQLLVKNPAHRFPSARGVVDAIEVIESSHGYSSHPTPPPSAAPLQGLEGGGVLRLDDGKTLFEDEERESAVPPEEAGGDEFVDWVDELTGTELGHYQIESLIGRGFHGAVFRASDLRDGRAVALKVLDPDFPRDDAEVRRFVRAVKPLLALRHPNVVSLLGAGKSGAYCWMALEYVEGESLTGRLGRLRSGSQKLDWRRGLRVAIHVARALEFGLQHRLSHRNVTPENILWDGASKIAKLGDLALWQALEGSSLRDAVAEDKRRAELPYLSPEEIEGSQGDDLSDLYSLGAVVYALLTGRPPFEGSTPAETAAQIRGGEAVRPRKLHRATPTDLEWVVLTMLSRDRRFRFQAPAELLIHLERIALEQGLVL